MMKPYTAKAAVLAASLLLTGCSTTAYRPQTPDTPMPSYSGSHLCEKDERGQLERLSPGHTCLALVQAGAWLTRLPVAVENKQVYAFAIPAGQFWYDESERIVPPKVGTATLLKRMANSWKRLPKSDWFALVAAVVPPGDLSKQELQTQEVGPSLSLAVHNSGQLALYPNDAVGPPLLRNYFYDNNHGQIWVSVTRLQ